MKIIKLDRMKEALRTINIISAIEAGFAAYSAGKAVVPPVGEMVFDDPPGDVHIKYGYLRGEKYYVIKIASGFYENPQLNLPSNNGLMLLFNRQTGELLSILLDEGYLTDVRTAAAGAITAKYLAPKQVQRIGIFGTGVQGRMQLQYLQSIVDCRDVIVWGRHQQNLDAYREAMEPQGYTITTTRDADEVAASCSLIVTATPAKTPFLHAKPIQKGTHITAMGSDTPEKNELAPEILRRADVVVADSITQCMVRGETAHAIKAKAIKEEDLIELGDVLSGKKAGRTSKEQITVADLTGVAVQDIQIAKVVYEFCR